MKIYLNNSHFIEVRDIIISTSQDGPLETANVTVTLFGTDEEEIQTFNLDHTENGVYISAVPHDLPIENGKRYRMVTNIVAEGFVGQWEQYVIATTRMNDPALSC